MDETQPVMLDDGIHPTTKQIHRPQNFIDNSFSCYIQLLLQALSDGMAKTSEKRFN